MELEVKNLSFSYWKKKEKVLENISFSLQKGEIGILLGRNGIGKSTLLKLIANLIKPSEGSVSIESEDVSKLSRNKLAKKISYLPQQIDIPTRLVKDEVMLGRLPNSFFFNSKNDEKIVNQCLQEVGIEKLSHRYTTELSGGEKQKVGIARSLSSEANLFLMDEPTASLDIKSSFELIELIKSLSRNKKITFLIAMHDISLASSFGDKFFLLGEKNLYAEGDKSVLNEPNLNNVFNMNAKIQNIDGDILLTKKKEDMQ